MLLWFVVNIHNWEKCSISIRKLVNIKIYFLLNEFYLESQGVHRPMVRNPFFMTYIMILTLILKLPALTLWIYHPQSACVGWQMRKASTQPCCRLPSLWGTLLYPYPAFCKLWSWMPLPVLHHYSYFLCFAMAQNVLNRAFGSQFGFVFVKGSSFPDLSLIISRF